MELNQANIPQYQAHSSKIFPVVVTIADSDSCAGAGIQADLKAMHALGVYAATVITAITAQNTTGVKQVQPIPLDMVLAQLNAVFDDMHVRAVKTGVLGDAATIHALAQSLSSRPLPLVVDPIICSPIGTQLLDAAAISVLKQNLLPQATLFTPNLPEVAILLETTEASCIAEAQQQAQALLAYGMQAVLLKGGHFQSDMCVDLLVLADNTCLSFPAHRIFTPNTHGTGCTLAAAITACLAKGDSLVVAVQKAKDYLNQALRHGEQMQVGRGCGPLQHFFALSS